MGIEVEVEVACTRQTEGREGVLCRGLRGKGGREMGRGFVRVGWEGEGDGDGDGGAKSSPSYSGVDSE